MNSIYQYDLYSAQQCNVCLIYSATKKETEDSNKILKKAQQNKLLTCSRCNLVKYCSTEHQLLDWDLHRQLCRAAQRIKQHYKAIHPFLITNTPKNGKELEQLIMKVKFLFKTILVRPLELFEEEILSFPSVCGVCYKIPCKLLCDNCKAVSYCCAAHKEESAISHSITCQQLKVFYCPYKILTIEKEVVEAFYAGVNLQNCNLKEAFEKTTLKMIPNDPTVDKESYFIFSTAADYSCIATISYALSHIEKQKLENEIFTIIIVGATIEGEIWFNDNHTKFFFLHYPKMKVLNLYFVGPELAYDNKERTSTYKFMNAERRINFYNHKMFYEDFEKKYRIEPSMIISYNSGFSENIDKDDLKKNTWPAAIDVILQHYGVPIVFTSYTKAEGKFDYAAFLKQSNKFSIKIDRIFKTSKNPFHDLRPIRNINICDEEQIYYRNGYIQAIYTSLIN